MYTTRNMKSKDHIKVSDRPPPIYCSCKKPSRNTTLGHGKDFCNNCNKWIKDKG